VIEGPDGLRQPLEHPEHPLFDDSVTTLDELGTRVEELISG
jgi:hypothetical protein